MTQKRRFTDEEVSEILTRATEVEPPRIENETSPTGMTLAELKDIGREVGIAPDRIERAAESLDTVGERAVAHRPRSGPVDAVRHLVPLARDLTDREWERVVTDARQTFDALGRVEQHGSLRAWSNGNLAVMVEPSPEGGHRLRMQTRKSGAREQAGAGLALLGVAAILAVLIVVGARDWAALLGPAFLGAVGVGLRTAVRTTLPRWAAERQRQMEGLGDRVLALVAADAENPTERLTDE